MKLEFLCERFGFTGYRYPHRTDRFVRSTSGRSCDTTRCDTIVCTTQPLDTLGHLDHSLFADCSKLLQSILLHTQYAHLYLVVISHYTTIKYLARSCHLSNARCDSAPGTAFGGSQF